MIEKWLQWAGFLVRNTATVEDQPHFEPVMVTADTGGMEQFMTITAMEEYRALSLEELRLKEYEAGRKDYLFKEAARNPPFRPIYDFGDGIPKPMQTITTMREYEHLSLEELRLRDYESGNCHCKGNCVHIFQDRMGVSLMLGLHLFTYPLRSLVNGMINTKGILLGKVDQDEQKESTDAGGKFANWPSWTSAPSASPTRAIELKMPSFPSHANSEDTVLEIGLASLPPEILHEILVMLPLSSITRLLRVNWQIRMFLLSQPSYFEALDIWSSRFDVAPLHRRQDFSRRQGGKRVNWQSSIAEHFVRNFVGCDSYDTYLYRCTHESLQGATEHDLYLLQSRAPLFLQRSLNLSRINGTLIIRFVNSLPQKIRDVVKTLNVRGTDIGAKDFIHLLHLLPNVTAVDILNTKIFAELSQIFLCPGTLRSISNFNLCQEWWSEFMNCRTSVQWNVSDPNATLHGLFSSGFNHSLTVTGILVAVPFDEWRTVEFVKRCFVSQETSGIMPTASTLDFGFVCSQCTHQYWSASRLWSNSWFPLKCRCCDMNFCLACWHRIQVEIEQQLQDADQIEMGNRSHRDVCTSCKLTGMTSVAGSGLNVADNLGDATAISKATYIKRRKNFNLCLRCVKNCANFESCTLS
ncbi:hypothetical protein M427DRAFT_155634 [Gonapodya prolifera JEL478]|uniref:F-box domain-containing protein n=1 Tax=Gonapodya prolifera (strain JEL478) TaxID=1344416 RepID=A0A139AEX3_GONPJ|nr:hypothetical protein M427DRAFT_155634 [Gonapodya prolifera JEL478]|eukprot:KXS14973.1 hypothetical protein M427DRAFT_155634 [Gonapodya prolifera JEL478]